MSDFSRDSKRGDAPVWRSSAAAEVEAGAEEKLPVRPISEQETLGEDAVIDLRDEVIATHGGPVVTQADGAVVPDAHADAAATAASRAAVVEAVASDTAAADQPQLQPQRQAQSALLRPFFGIAKALKAVAVADYATKTRATTPVLLVRLALIAAAISWCVAAGYLGPMLIVFGIFFLIMFHEFGHFLAAKAVGVKATEFFVGFGPRIWSFRRGETEFGVRLIPAGGFVKTIGMTNLEEVDPADEPRTYRQKSYWRRLVVVLAGPFMNLLLAGILLWVAAVFLGMPTGQPTTRVGATMEFAAPALSPAKAADLRKNDTIVAIDGKPVKVWEDAVAAFSAAPNRTLAVDVRRPDVKGLVHLTVTPVDRAQVRTKDDAAIRSAAPSSAAPTGVGFVGISPKEAVEKEGPIAALGTSTQRLGTGIAATWHAFERIFSPSGVETYAKNVAGTLPTEQQATADQNRFISAIGLWNYAKAASDDGTFMALMMLASINVSVGLLNLAPFLPLDGGHAVVALYGWVRSIGKRQYHVVDFRRLEPAMYFVVFLLVAIAVSAMWLDITHPLTNL